MHARYVLKLKSINNVLIALLISVTLFIFASVSDFFGQIRLSYLFTETGQVNFER